MVADLIRSEIATMLLKEIKDPRIGFITITRVELTPDLRQVRVLYSVVGTEEEQRATQEGLESATNFIRGRLGRRLSNLRRVPEIVFRFDPSLAKATRVVSLISKMEK